MPTNHLRRSLLSTQFKNRSEGLCFQHKINPSQKENEPETLRGWELGKVSIAAKYVDRKPNNSVLPLSFQSLICAATPLWSFELSEIPALYRASQIVSHFHLFSAMTSSKHLWEGSTVGPSTCPSAAANITNFSSCPIGDLR
jgi:hypothetical protein